MSSNRALFKGQRCVCVCVRVNICICVCAYGTDGGVRPFDVSPDGPGQLAEEEQSRGHWRDGGRTLGPVLSLPLSACLALPPLINKGS